MKKIVIAGADEEICKDLFWKLVEKYDHPTEKSVEVSMKGPITEVVDLITARHGLTNEERTKKIQEQVDKYNLYTHLILYTYNSFGKDSWKLWAEDAIYERVYKVFFSGNKKVKVILITTPGDQSAKIGAMLSGIILDHGKKG